MPAFEDCKGTNNLQTTIYICNIFAVVKSK
jgi:hypothetical protein